MGLLDCKGAELPTQIEGEQQPSVSTRVLELRQSVETFKFMGLQNPPILSLLRGLSAPVKVHYDYSDEELMLLMAHDTDDFNRWDASQTLGQRIILNMVQSKKLEIPPGYLEAVREALNNNATDHALLAELLMLPSESYLGDQMEEVDVEGIHTASEAVKKNIATELKDDLLRCYRACQRVGNYRPDPVDIGRRRLKNICMSYLMQLDDTQMHALCFQQFQENHNMTDVIAALNLLANYECPERVQALEQFYDKWKDDPLVLDKWFSIQATSKLPGTLEKVKELRKNPAFSIKNPNKVRSLLGAFCSANPIGFHAADGAGYVFLADAVLELDKLNPQVASRMLRIMSRWQRYDSSRQKLMQFQLQRILVAEGASKDVYEIALKSVSS